MRGIAFAFACLAALPLAACNMPHAAADAPPETAEQFAAEHPYNGGASMKVKVSDLYTKVQGPDGLHDWVVVQCGNVQECWAHAGEACPTGFSLWDKDKSTAYDVSSTSSSRSASVSASVATPHVSTAATLDESTTESQTRVLPIEHGQMFVKCASPEQNDAKLLDELKALCDDGNDKACKGRDFAVKKRGCCAWHGGARKCNDDGHVVCFDGVVSQACGC
jgi:hypothetical protein